MARPQDDALKYYNQDTKDDDNLQYVEAIHSHIGYAIVHKLWKHIYGSPGGYYCEWTDINKRLFCKNNNITLPILDEILDTCFQDDVRIFDKKMVDEFKILTSKGIQKRWLKIVKECGRKNNTVDERYRLVALQAVTNQENTPPLSLNGKKTTQSKEKESKEKEIVIGEGIGSHSNNFENGKNEKSEKRMPPQNFTAPTQPEVNDWFAARTKDQMTPEFSNLQSQKFFNHYSSIGWQTNGNDITDWQALANTWILEDLEKLRGTKNNVRTTMKSAATKKNNSFIEACYREYCEGTLKEDGIPFGIYDQLSDEKLICLTDQAKSEILVQCNNNPHLAKKRAIATFFDQLKERQQPTVFINQFV